MNKKIVALFTAGLLLASLCSCGPKEKTPDPSDVSNVEASNTVSEEDAKFLYETFDDEYVKTFVSDYLKGKEVPMNAELAEGKIKSVLIGESKESTAKVIKDMLTSTADAIVEEGASEFNVEITKTETSVIIKVHYNVKEVEEAEKEVVETENKAQEDAGTENQPENK